MTSVKLKFLLPLTILAAGLALTLVSQAQTVEGSAIPQPTTRLTLADEPADEISPLLFGQFLERFGAKVDDQQELGPQAALTPGGEALQAGVLVALGELNASIIRFPGGAALASLYDWTQMIDYSPLRNDPARPEGFEFGLPEFFELCETLDAEPLPVVNFRAAVWGTRPGEVALSPEAFAAGLVAYCNLPVGAELPEGMPDWPALRAANGHPEPHGVRYFQIGNEWVAWLHATNKVQKKLGQAPFPDDASFIAHVTERLLDVIAAMRAVDPQIEIIIDAVAWEPAHKSWFRTILSDERVRAAADFAAVHIYRPWGVKDFKKDGEVIEADRLSPEDLWYATVAAPNIAPDGQSVLRHESWSLARELGWPVTLTEWNWNGWGVERYGSTLWPRALGAAGFLHAFLREAEHIELATQSMMLGNWWMINGVRADPTGEAAPFVLPTGRMTGFYAEHSGDRFLPVDLENAPVRPQPVSIGSLKAAPRLALIDAVASESEDAVFLHLINRDKDRALPVQLDLGDRSYAPEVAIHRMTGRPWNPQEALFVSPGQFEESSETGSLSTMLESFELPPASVTIIELLKED